MFACDNSRQAILVQLFSEFWGIIFGIVRFYVMLRILKLVTSSQPSC